MRGFFEDRGVGAFRPLTETRPFLATIPKRLLGLEGTVLLVPPRVEAYVRSVFRGVFVNPEEVDEDLVLLNSRLHPGDWERITSILGTHGSNLLIHSSGTPVGLRVSRRLFNAYRPVFQAPLELDTLLNIRGEVDVVEVDARLANNPSDVISNATWLLEKAAGPQGVRIEGVVEEGVRIDTSSGPVVVDGGVVEAYSRLRGPVYIGPGARVLSGSRLENFFGDSRSVVWGIASNVMLHHASRLSAHYSSMLLAGAFSTVLAPSSGLGVSIVGDGGHVASGPLPPGSVYGIFSITLSPSRCVENFSEAGSGRRLGIDEVFRLLRNRAREVGAVPPGSYELLVKALYEKSPSLCP